MSGERDYDVIVVGGGAAGLAASIEASAAGASVLLLEAGSRVGGSSALSSGVVYAGNSEVQREAGINDTSQAMLDYGLTVTQNRLDASLARRMCEDSASLITWLRAIGATIKPDRLYHGGVEPEGLRRSHRVEGGGPKLIEILEGYSSSSGVEIVCNMRVDKLHLGSDGSVAGVIVGDDIVRSGAVVLASGGFGENEELVRRYFPTAVEAAGDWLWHIGNKHSLGDGLRMAEQVGARVTGHDRGLISLTHRFDKDNELFHPDWLVFVNENGRRFMREFENYGICAQSVIEQPGRHCFAIFDENARLAARQRPDWAGIVKMHWTETMIPEMVKAGKMVMTDAIEDLASRLGIDGAVLARTIEIYNRDCEAKNDTAYGKSAESMLPLLTPPFYGAEIRPATLAATFTGLAIDRDASVLDSTDRPIAGLFAAGETTNAIGSLYWGGGFALATCMVFGRRAGRAAAQLAKQEGRVEGAVAA